VAAPVSYPDTIIFVLTTPFFPCNQSLCSVPVRGGGYRMLSGLHVLPQFANGFLSRHHPRITTRGIGSGDRKRIKGESRYLRTCAYLGDDPGCRGGMGCHGSPSYCGTRTYTCTRIRIRIWELNPGIGSAAPAERPGILGSSRWRWGRWERWITFVEWQWGAGGTSGSAVRDGQKCRAPWNQHGYLIDYGK
jgi:hypothetical protein